MESPDLLRTFLDSMPTRHVERDLAKGERLFSRGDVPSFMFWVRTGEVRLVRTSPMGSEIVFQRARHGFLAEASSNQRAYHCDGVAAMTTRVQAIPIEEFRAALTRPEVQAEWIRHLSQELRRVRAHAERLSLRTTEERIIHFIETEGTEGELVLSQSKKSWAAEMGMTHEALYRTLRSMVDHGALIISGNRIRQKPAPQAVPDTAGNGTANHGRRASPAPPAAAKRTTNQGGAFHAIRKTKQARASANSRIEPMALVKTGE